MNERNAITYLKHGDIAGLEYLVREYQVQAVRAAYLITRDRALAEDIVQAAFIRAYERIDQFDIDRSFGPWFLKSVTNDAIKAAQRRKRHVPLEAPTDTDASSLLQHLVDKRPEPVDDVQAAETREEIWEALGKLPPAAASIAADPAFTAPRGVGSDGTVSDWRR